MQASVEAAEEKSGGLAYKWIVAGVVIFGLFMSVLLFHDSKRHLGLV